jgi:hypothetical protein
MLRSTSTSAELTSWERFETQPNNLASLKEQKIFYAMVCYQLAKLHRNLHPKNNSKMRFLARQGGSGVLRAVVQLANHHQQVRNRVKRLYQFLDEEYGGNLRKHL